MTAVAELIRKARADGVELVVRDGGLKARGAPEALDIWLPALRSRKAELLAMMTGEPDTVPDVQALARAYNQHHFKCPQCIAAGKGYGSRCAVGLTLWSAYQEAANDAAC